ncbi:unnamed protein product [Parnassius apollo]|uniref:(apollo) hypothetical protein n=1 Tax=Parnassius apollo TaxID=110799 RepID=A0A8S3X9Z1_PARAO|nr:unnamed protein product [Parnassius apollo]
MRTYKRKTTRGTKSLEVYELAAREVIEKNRNYRDVAKEFDLCHVSLFNFVKKKKAGAPATVGYKKTRLVFSAEQEAIIAEYLLKCANIYFGLLPEDVKRLSYQCAKFYNVENVPESWRVNEMADPSNQNQSLISKPPVENEVNDDDLSLNLENPEILNDMPYLDISVTEVIEHMSNEPIAGSSGIQKDVNDFFG